jgi:hypothetical protein
MIVATHGVMQKAGGAAYDADFQAKLNQATFLGYGLPTGTTYLNAENDFYLNLKDPTRIGLDTVDSLYAKTQRGYNHVTNGSSGYACLEMKAPSSNPATLILAPSLVSGQGFQGNGTSSYVKYGVAGGIYEQNSAFVLSVVHTWGTNLDSHCIFATNSSGANNSVWFRFVTPQVRINASGISSVTNYSGTAKSTFLLTRTGASAFQYLERRGVSATTNVALNGTTASSNLPTEEFMALSRNGANFSTGIAAMNFFGEGLSDQEAKDYITIVNTYLAAIGW